MHFDPCSISSENLLVSPERAQAIKRESTSLLSVNLGHRQMCDLELLLSGAFAPLSGYIGREDYESVLESMRLADGSVWPMPICLTVDETLGAALSHGDILAIRDSEGLMLAALHVQDAWRPDMRREALAVFGVDDPDKHPGARRLMENSGRWHVGGRLEGLRLPTHYDFPELRLTPSDTRRMFTGWGWRKVIGFDTAEHPHCAHKEMLSQAARQAGARIFIQHAVGEPRPGNLGHFTSVRCHKAFAEQFPKSTACLGLIPLASRQAGPREALWKALVLSNHGCTHTVVAERQDDPLALACGSEGLYPRWAALEMVSELAPETGVEAVPLEPMAYVEDKAHYVVARDLPACAAARSITSQELQRRLDLDLDIPEWFSSPAVVAELRKAHPPRHSRGFTVFITGLSGAGKSTLAKILYVKFMETFERPVTLLDGDIVRRNLSSELGFSREHRNLNIQRIGFVASEITKNRGIAICAPIAPYPESRRVARELVSRHGGFIEVHLSTPIEVCEQRDRKGIYAKARAGVMRGVTGLDAPYIPPTNPELVIDTSAIPPIEAAQEILLFLEQEGYVR